MTISKLPASAVGRISHFLETPKEVRSLIWIWARSLSKNPEEIQYLVKDREAWDGYIQKMFTKSLFLFHKTWGSRNICQVVCTLAHSIYGFHNPYPSPPQVEGQKKWIPGALTDKERQEACRQLIAQMLNNTLRLEKRLFLPDRDDKIREMINWRAEVLKTQRAKKKSEILEEQIKDTHEMLSLHLAVFHGFEDPEGPTIQIGNRGKKEDLAYLLYGVENDEFSKIKPPQIKGVPSHFEFVNITRTTPEYLSHDFKPSDTPQKVIDRYWKWSLNQRYQQWARDQESSSEFIKIVRSELLSEIVRSIVTPEVQAKIIKKLENHAIWQPYFQTAFTKEPAIWKKIVASQNLCKAICIIAHDLSEFPNPYDEAGPIHSYVVKGSSDSLPPSEAKKHPLNAIETAACKVVQEINDQRSFELALDVKPDLRWMQKAFPIAIKETRTGRNYLLFMSQLERLRPCPKDQSILEHYQNGDLFCNPMKESLLDIAARHNAVDSASILLEQKPQGPRERRLQLVQQALQVAKASGATGVADLLANILQEENLKRPFDSEESEGESSTKRQRLLSEDPK